MNPKPLLVLLAVGSVLATAPAAERWSLLRPKPDNALRELSTDRPDKTESPYTVDAGHYQVESDLVTYARDRADGVTTERLSLAATNLKVGLLDDVDLQVVVEPYVGVRSRGEADGTSDTKTGIGDTTVRLKVNWWGNDGGDTAFATMPFVKLPTNQDDLGNDDVEGGLIMPLALSLPRGWSLGTMLEVDVDRDADDQGYHAVVIVSVTAGHAIVGDLSGYAELLSESSLESGVGWVGYGDVGLTYRLGSDVQLDAGVNVGLNSDAEDINPFIGFSARL